MPRLSTHADLGVGGFGRLELLEFSLHEREGPAALVDDSDVLFGFVVKAKFFAGDLATKQLRKRKFFRIIIPIRLINKSF